MYMNGRSGMRLKGRRETMTEGGVNMIVASTRGQWEGGISPESSGVEPGLALGEAGYDSGVATESVIAATR